MTDPRSQRLYVSESLDLNSGLTTKSASTVAGSPRWLPSEYPFRPLFSLTPNLSWPGEANKTQLECAVWFPRLSHKTFHLECLCWGGQSPCKTSTPELLFEEGLQDSHASRRKSLDGAPAIIVVTNTWMKMSSWKPKSVFRMRLRLHVAPWKTL